MFSLSKKGRWTDAIADISTREEFQNCTIELRDPGRVTSVEDIDNGGFVDVGDSLVWSGPARYIPYRWGINHEGNVVGNASTWVAGMVQLPKNAVDRAARGWTVTITDSRDNPTLETFLFKVTSDLQGSNSAARTFQVAADTDQILDLGPEPGYGFGMGPFGMGPFGGTPDAG